MSIMKKDAYSVEVIGFNQTERIVLSSIFGLSARRQPKFTQHSSVSFSPDLFLVDSSDAQALALFNERNATRRVPAIMIGSSDHGTGYPLLERPLQWTRLFKAFDLAIAADAAAQSDFEKTLPNVIPVSSLASAGIPPTPTPTPAHTSPMPVFGDALAKTTPVLPIQTTASQVAPSWFALPPTPPPAPPTAAVAMPTLAAADWVLVVDDNLTVREFMRNKLSPFNFNVDYAESGEQAVGLTGQRRYACVFLDVVMPGIDGYQVCKLIKSKKTQVKTHVVMLTSKGSPFDKIRGAMAGCDAYLTKPVNEEKLLETIVRFLPKHA